VNNQKFRRWTKFLAGLSILLGVTVLVLIAYIIFSRVSGNKYTGISVVPDYDHIVVVVEENESAKRIIGNPEASFINSLATTNSLAAQYYGTDHPSLPNYIRMTSGKYAKLDSTCSPENIKCQVTGKNIMDEVEASGRNWKAYFEDMPDSCATQSTELYSLDYNPFVYYSDIIGSPDRCRQHVVPFSQFEGDLNSSENFPDLVFISPNTCNDMHNCSVATGDLWLAKTVTTLLNSPIFTEQKSLLVVTWDESDHPSTNNIPLIFAGSYVKRGYRSVNQYNHLSLLKTIETAWKLPHLNRTDRDAKVMSEFFNN